MQLHTEDLREHVVSVVATRPDRELASFSNRCGIAAPGVHVPVAYCDPEDPADPHASAFASPRRSQEIFSGTSFAAPLVTGGFAVLKHQFCGQLGNQALLERLYATADKQGPAAPDQVSEPDVRPAHLDTDGDLSACELTSTHGQGISELLLGLRRYRTIDFNPPICVVLIALRLTGLGRRRLIGVERDAAL